MMYRKEIGFAAIRSMEPDEALKAINEPLRSASSLEWTLDGAAKGTVSVAPDAPAKTILNGADADVKFLHIGAPLGVLLSKSALEKPLSEVLAAPGVSLGSMRVYVGSAKECIVSYLSAVLDTLQPESCGRCVLCRLGIDQLRRILADAMNGKGRPDDLATLRSLSGAMRQAAHCRLGKGVGALTESFLAGFSMEFEDHAKRKKCPAGVCKNYLSYIILPNLCTGCGDCLDECEDDAIEGKPKFIHMIDELECSRCGRCAAVCEENAIVLAGAVHPRLPTKLTRVGTWKGR